MSSAPGPRGSVPRRISWYARQPIHAPRSSATFVSKVARARTLAATVTTTGCAGSSDKAARTSSGGPKGPPGGWAADVGEIDTGCVV